MPARPLFTAPLPGSPSLLFHRPGDPPPFPATHPAERPGYIRLAHALLAGARDSREWFGREALGRITEDSVVWARALSAKLVRGAIDLGGWFRSTLDGLVSRHYAGALALTKGIIPQASVLDRLDARIDRQAGFLRRFRSAIGAGASKGAGLVARAGLYGAAVWGVAQGTERDAIAQAPNGQWAFERRILDDGAEHCEICPPQAALGWQPIGTLRPIGDTPCQVNCRCYFEYSDGPPGESARFTSPLPGSPSHLLGGRQPTVVRMPGITGPPRPPAPRPTPTGALEPSPTPTPATRIDPAPEVVIEPAAPPAPRPAPKPPASPAPKPEPKPKPKPEPPKFGPSAARVRHIDVEEEEIDRAVKTVLGGAATKQDLASIVGAPDDALVDVATSGKSFVGETIRATIHGDGYRAIRQVKRNMDGELTIDNTEFYVEADRQGQGIGREVFGRQVETAARLGVKRIDTLAAGGPGQETVGYLVWPRLGYDGPIPEAVKANLPPEHAEAANVSDLMRTPEGRQWWTEHGQATYLSFDPTEGSPSRQVWDEYLRRKTSAT